MTRKRLRNGTVHEDRAPEPGGERYVLRLYVAGATVMSLRAMRNLTEFCKEYLPGRSKIEVVDIYQQPELARQHDVLAAPTLRKELPLPLRQLIGDLSDKKRLLLALNVVVPEQREPDGQ